MAIVVRYFSTSAAGAGDGTTWADRAALFSTGNWSTVITGFAFNGSDSMEARIGPGTYTCSQSLASGLFANAPTVANPLILHGADSSGNRLAPSNPGWQSAQPVDWDSGLPVIATTTNIATVNLATCAVRLIAFTSSGNTAQPTILGAMSVDWCTVVNSSSNTLNYGVSAAIGKASNCYVSMTGSSYRAAALYGVNGYNNVRLQGVTGSSGNRHGFEFTGSTSAGLLDECTVFGFGGDGVGTSSSTAGHLFLLKNCVIANNTGAGVKGNGTASQTAMHKVEHCMITGNGGYGIDAQSTARLLAVNNRLRDNTSGNFNGFGNYPTDFDNYVTDSDDASEYVDPANGDYRIKATSALWGKGYGAGDEPVTGSGGVVAVPYGIGHLGMGVY